MGDLRHHWESVPSKGQRLLALEERRTFSSSLASIQRPLYSDFTRFLLLCTLTAPSSDKQLAAPFWPPPKRTVFLARPLVVSSGDSLFVFRSQPLHRIDGIENSELLFSVSCLFFVPSSKGSCLT